MGNDLEKKEAHETPETIYGRLLESVHITGYSMERACSELEWLLDADRWKSVGTGYENIDAFLNNINLESFKIAVDRRKKLAKRLEELAATQRATAKALGVGQATITRDLNDEPSGSKPKIEPQEKQQLIEEFEPSGSKQPPTPPPQKPPATITNDGAAAAQAIQKKINSQETRETKRNEIITKLSEISAQKTKEDEGVYDVVVVDPPWPMEKIERDERPNQSEFEYPTMTEDEIGEIDLRLNNDCHVWLWTTHKFLPMAFRLFGRWGLKYVCTFVWHKPGGFQPYGLPQYNSEFALYARHGSPQFITTKNFPVCFNAPRGAHSEKPEEFYEMVRRVTGGRRRDMFNRRKIEGFIGWGKEAE